MAVPANWRFNYVYDPVTIADSGSASSLPFTIVVDRSGDATVVIGSQLSRGHVSAGIVKKLYTDVGSAGSLGRLPHGRCGKSVSFGASLTIAWKNAHSPDLSCPQNATAHALSDDINAITSALGIGKQVRRVLPSPQPLVPRTPVHRVVTPQPKASRR